MSETILISIHGQHVRNIIHKRKVFEFRKARPDKDVGRIVFYCTAPVAKIVAVADVLETKQMAPSALWSQTGAGSGISRRFYREYFNGRRQAVAFVLGQVHTLKEPLGLDQLPGNCVAPMSYRYLSDEELKVVLRQKNLSPIDSANTIFAAGSPDESSAGMLNHSTVSSAGYTFIQAADLIRGQGNDANPLGKEFCIDSNQRALLKGLHSSVQRYFRVMLKGHFTLIDKEMNIVPIDVKVFKKMNPARLILVKVPAAKVASVLHHCSGRMHSDKFVRLYQKKEEDHANLVAKAIGVQLKIIDSSIKSHVLSRLCLTP